jgi:ceramide glucosyltransferase
MMTFFLFLCVTGIVTSTIYALLVAHGAIRFAARRRQTRRQTRPVGFEPPATLLKPLHGSEPELEAHLESFFLQDYPSFEIIFCARTDNDPAMEVARRLAARYPGTPVKFLASGRPPYANAKVWSLERMQPLAEHDFLIVSDSDVAVGPQYLREIMAPFADETVGLVTCLYRGVARWKDGLRLNLWAALEAVGMSIEMPSGVLVASMIEGMKFALGPTMAVRRRCLEGAGGFAAVGKYHADDFMLGHLVAAGGGRVVLSTHVIDHYVLNTSLLSSIRHQMRWMTSTRFSRPKGHLGSALTYSMPYGLVAAAIALALHRPQLAVGLLAWAWATRAWIVLMVGGMVVREPNLVAAALLYPFRDFLGFFYWIASYFSNVVLWREETYRLHPDGSMQRGSRPVDRAVLTT